MDSAVLEFMGTMLLEAAKGQRRIEELSQWFGGGAGGVKGFTEAFARAYGVEIEACSERSLALWKKTFDALAGSIMELASAMDLVPRRDYAALAEENDALRQRVGELEQEVQRLAALLEGGTRRPADGLEGFSRLIEEQARHYREFMANLGDALGRAEGESGRPFRQEGAGRPPKGASVPGAHRPKKTKKAQPR
ncbi:MAG TPA: hypothetical protein PLS81_01070 [Deltaproteobacteria bacterium]|nr:hypothetical protein [Deltaproteobacteria bacterium]HOM28033.1 hypothetical protein [Deltaproteobacteria bacterium]HPP80127.1 hypothetical protein [Deltaproteobacteria bacterium]